MRKVILVLIVAGLMLSESRECLGSFTGLDSQTLPAVEKKGQWGLQIVIFNVGQADAILLLTPGGDACLIDSGKTKSDGKTITGYLKSKSKNNVGKLTTVKYLFTTHYDSDHIGGLPWLIAEGIYIQKAYDQGVSTARELEISSGGLTKYGAYVQVVGDDNNNMTDDEPGVFIRNQAQCGYSSYLSGADGMVEVECVAVRGDTKGTQYDVVMNPLEDTDDENSGSVALLIQYHDFEMYTAGDQTDDDWKSEKAVEESVIHSKALGKNPDIDVIKVSHHGSDTSTSTLLVKQLKPEAAVISSKYVKGQNLPKKIAIKQFQENQCYVLITGDGKNPAMGDYCDSTATYQDDTFTAEPAAVFNKAGNVTIFVSVNGRRYTVYGRNFKKTFSSKDSDNPH